MNLSIQSMYNSSIEAKFNNVKHIQENKNILEFQEQKIPYTPTSMKNDRVPTRIIEKTSINFGLPILEVSSSVIENINILKQIIMPIYSRYEGQLQPVEQNFTGLIKLKFDGNINYHQIFLTKRDFILHLTNFTLSYNKEAPSDYYEGVGVVPRYMFISIEGISIQNYVEYSRV